MKYYAVTGKNEHDLYILIRKAVQDKLKFKRNLQKRMIKITTVVSIREIFYKCYLQVHVKFLKDYVRNLLILPWWVQPWIKRTSGFHFLICFLKQKKCKGKAEKWAVEILAPLLHGRREGGVLCWLPLQKAESSKACLGTTKSQPLCIRQTYTICTRCQSVAYGLKAITLGPK